MDAIALAGSRGAVSYGAMLDGVARVAGAVAAAVPAGQAVATLLSHTPEGIMGMLGCLVSGRVCIILNPGDPPARLAMILEDAAPRLLLANDAAMAARAPGQHVLLLADALAAPAGPFNAPAFDPDAPAVVQFTSGSSGRPKGIVLPMRAVLSRTLHVIAGWRLDAGDRSLATSLTSVGSGLAFLLAPLCVGARALVVDVSAEGASAVVRLARREAVTVAAFGAALLSMLLRLEEAGAAFTTLRSVRVGAAGLPRAVVAGWRPVLPAACAISHTYASTEALIVSEWTIPADDASAEIILPVGYPVAGTDWWLRDEADARVAAGGVGEMVVRSREIALGEWRQGRLQPGRLLPDPERPGWRIFHTGDLLRVGADGLLRFVCRVDRQVKMNGVRIEPAEVEAVLRAAPDVTDCAVIARPNGPGLLAIIAAEPLDTAALLRTLAALARDALPPTLRPARMVVIAALPRLPNGKLDFAGMTRLAEAQT